MKSVLDEYRTAVLASGSVLPHYQVSLSPESAEPVHALLMRVLLQGMADAAEGLELADSIELVSGLDPVPFEEAERILKSKIPLTRDEYYELSNKMKLRAFTVSRLSSLDAVNAVRRRLAREVKGESSLREFLSEAESDSFQQWSGWGEENPWYWENVYRTNTQTAYNAGRALQFESNPPEFLEFIGIEDSRQTSICESRSGTVRRYDDPWWKENWPPLHFQCRSTVRGVYGGTDESAEVGETPVPDGEGAQKGFGAWPLDKETYWTLTDSMVRRAIEYRTDAEIVQLAHRMGMKSYAPELLKGAEDVYPEKPGSVLVAVNHGAGEREGNIMIGRVFADRGDRVYLLPVSSAPGVKNPDAIMNDVLIEFKTVSSLKALRRNYHHALKQATDVAIYLKQDLPMDKMLSSLKGELLYLMKKEQIEPHSIFLITGSGVREIHSSELL